MHEKVKEFLDTKKAEEIKEAAEKKQKTLIGLGLFEKEYSDSEEYSVDFPFSEYDSENLKLKWYKEKAIDVTDEEYAEILKHAGKHAKAGTSNSMNAVAIVLTIIAWITFIVGFFAGIAFGIEKAEIGIYYTYTDTEFSFATAFAYWCASFISGTMFLGFAEIIKLLDNIKNK
ncbi:MAG: hypothetical protein IKI97_03575 [Clostridia bacterium]|nr:hypothetical protein [Clostridia bacterium]